MKPHGRLKSFLTYQTQDWDTNKATNLKMVNFPNTLPQATPSPHLKITRE